MKTIKCKACGTDISPKAKTCPKCGHPNTPSTMESLGRLIKVMFVGTAVLIGVVYCAGNRESTGPAMESTQMRDQRLINASQTAVRSRLKDGASALFQNVVLNQPKGGQPAFVVCGEVNSKNSFGAMSGFQSFIAAGSDPNLVFLEEQVKDFAKSWNELCVK